MKYEFDRLIDRRNTGSLKWDVPEGELPMWVADMDFQTAPEILEAIQKKVDRGIFGYQVIPDSWYHSIMHWWETRHHYAIQREWIAFSTGVIPSVTTAIQIITNVGDQVVVQTPVYNHFFNAIEDRGRNPLESRLLYDGETYRMDLLDLEEKLAQPRTTMMLLCNPQNPSGNIWSREELAQIGELCARHNVTVLSDEIHCDLMDPGYEYVPFASVSERNADISITCVSTSKPFNIAGLQGSAVIIPDPHLREKVVQALHTGQLGDPNAFVIEAMTAAFTGGGDWLDALCAYVSENRKMAQTYVEKEIPKVRVVPSHATYLLWLDCREVTQDSEKLAAFLRRETGLYLCKGSIYRGDGSGFLRMNIACPKSQVEKGLLLLQQGVERYLQDSI